MRAFRLGLWRIRRLSDRTDGQAGQYETRQRCSIESHIQQVEAHEKQQEVIEKGD